MTIRRGCGGSPDVWRWLALALAILVGLAATVDRHVSVVAPAYAGSAVTIRVTVEPLPDQRRAGLIADSGQHFRASEWPLEGTDGPRTTWVEWRDLDRGEYELLAWVQTDTGRIHRSARRTMVVFGP